MADFRDRSNNPQAGAVTGGRDLIVAPNMLKWVAEGKVWCAGVGPENAGIDSQAAMDDLAPDVGLVASSSSAVFVVPILLRMSVHTEGGALNQLQVTYTRAASDCATTLSVSGTAMTAIQNKDSANNGSPTASALYTCTSSALTNADYVSMILATQADNPVSGTGGLAFNRGCVFELDLLKDPTILRSGAALLVYPYTATTDQKYLPYLVWAELTEDDLR